ncbi:hypothetical protein COBT_000770 [Conglomerata obtusa]
MKRPCYNNAYEYIETRTVLVTNISSIDDNILIKEKLAEYGAIRESYTIQENKSILFAIFYDLRQAIKAKNEMNDMKIGESNIKTHFTISKYEIPKEGDLCDETRNQGTLLVISRNLDVPLTNEELSELFEPFGDIKEIREYRTFQKFIEFWDTRNTVRVYNEFGERKYKSGVLMLRYLWDTTRKMRWDLIKITDNILEGNNQEILKIPVKAVKDHRIKEKNIYARAMDDFIIENLDEIQKLID